MYRTTIYLQVLVKTKLIYGNKNLNLEKSTINKPQHLRDMCNKALILPLNNHFCEINFLKTNMKNFLIVTG